jgi:hypothetical protein
MTAPTAAPRFTPGGRPVTRPRHSARASLVRAVLAGREPAEALPRREREDLMCAWHDAGWTDVEIAAHTRWSTYTVGRIRSALGLRPNHTH